MIPRVPPQAAWLALLGTIVVGRVGITQEPAAADSVADSLPPLGLGTLRQQDIAVLLETEIARFSVIPLDERIIRLLAPDSYQALFRLGQSRADEVAQVAARNGLSWATVFLVSVYGIQDQAVFDPDQLTIVSRNRYFRPVAILPLSPLWNQHRITQRETLTAIYLYEEGISLFEPFVIEYATVASDAWRQSLERLERERVRVESRATRIRNP